MLRYLRLCLGGVGRLQIALEQVFELRPLIAAHGSMMAAPHKPWRYLVPEPVLVIAQQPRDLRGRDGFAGLPVAPELALPRRQQLRQFGARYEIIVDLVEDVADGG